ncbi:FitA-like ribbon-helix-helix domain-containing protein [Tessaracoccus caeni]|uniref:FitA-like ribbon-helix-helix domain-containing protein n=1 Tax=Tessaracoccus caeni TaxID=3031239 RepID=UPI0023DC6604|nr:hypothetical protein [Tessaracoccus caeni]MDF1490062.1 hypothetical protein [Tessaracoccus caeni]
MSSTLLQIRGVDDETRAVLAARAVRRGQSLTAYLRELLEREAATPLMEEVFARVDRRSETASISSVELIRADRDR